MPLTAYYSAGTATLTNGSVNVTFQAPADMTTANVAPGDRIEADDGRTATLATVGPGPLVATLDKAFKGTTQAAQPYKIWRTFDAQYLMEGARNAMTLLGSGSIAALAALAGAANQGMYFTGPGVLAAFSLTAAGRVLLAGADVAAQRATLNAVNKAGDTMTGPLRNTGLPMCRVTRNNSAETFVVNTEYALLGSFNLNQGGFTAGAATAPAGSGNRLKVPVTGYYFIAMGIYTTVGGGGRLNVIVNGNPINVMAFGTSAVAGQKTYGFGVVLLNAGDELSYYCNIAGAQVFTASNHTDVTVIYLG
ncbi:hypothetical protein BPNPMPFG_000915 [Mesorhizobium sp. AR07]|uniref:hypothetical protein n=1 Tax=Mesorhizobium sp. AR07 TaxID=2865838 RepID=UPI002160B1C7|nr:hypothetical protein [Mesorhizobium sp. AR07]UVK45385.1 hypothetical protein BPNPMPFG_000915 [Mesorhizobium sp. AR07]